VIPWIEKQKLISAKRGCRYCRLSDRVIYRTLILPMGLYGCETWSLTLKEERKLRVFKNRVLRRIFGPKRDEVTGNGENYIMRS
jgi:hypothetical protein